MFKKELLKFIRSESNFTYNIHDTKELKLLTKLRLGISHLGGHKFRRNFQNCVSPMRSCGQDIETTTHFSFSAPIIIAQGKPFFHKITQVSRTTLRQSNSTITKILLFVDNKLDFETSKILLIF